MSSMILKSVLLAITVKSVTAGITVLMAWSSTPSNSKPLSSVYPLSLL